MYHKPRIITKAYGIGGYNVALASCMFRGVFDADCANLSIVERISEVVGRTVTTVTTSHKM